MFWGSWEGSGFFRLVRFYLFVLVFDLDRIVFRFYINEISGIVVFVGFSWCMCWENENYSSVIVERRFSVVRRG